MDLKNKTVVVAGATGGIGAEFSMAVSKEGARLLLISKTEDKLKELIKKLNGKDHNFLVCDFRNSDHIRKLEEHIRDKVERVDVLANVAGIGIYKPIEEADYCEWDDSMMINVTTPFYMIKLLLPLLKKSENPVVLNVGSGMGKIPTAGRSVYCASKFALRGLSLSLSEEYKNNNIHFVHIALGSTLTDFGPMSLKEKEEENLKGKAYFTPEWVAKEMINIIKAGRYQEEIELYPGDYTGKKWWISK
jgi:hypothetical protein